LPEEISTLTIGLYGNADFYLLKGIVEQMLAQLNIHSFDFSPVADHPAFHPGKTAKLAINGVLVGYLGEIHPEVAENFECPAQTYIAVLDVKSLIDNADMIRQYKHLPRYPAVSRDIAMLIRDEVLVKEIEALIRKQGGKLIEEVRLFDVYRGDQVPEGMKSVAYNITFRAPDRTLVDDDVNKAMEKILNGLKTSLDANLRE